MKTIGAIILFCGLAVAGTGAAFGGVTITENGTELEITSGKNAFLADLGDDYAEHLRIYGVNPQPVQEWSPLAYASYILMAGPYTGNTAECERKDAQSAKPMNVMVNDPEVAAKFDQLNAMQGRRHAMLTGKRVHVRQFSFEGKDMSDVLSQGAGQPIDPREALWVKDVSEVSE